MRNSWGNGLAKNRDKIPGENWEDKQKIQDDA